MSIYAAAVVILGVPLVVFLGSMVVATIRVHRDIRADPWHDPAPSAQPDVNPNDPSTWDDCAEERMKIAEEFMQNVAAPSAVEATPAPKNPELFAIERVDDSDWLDTRGEGGFSVFTSYEEAQSALKDEVDNTDESPDAWRIIRYRRAGVCSPAGD